MMKTPDEIKKGLEQYMSADAYDCEISCKDSGCPYRGDERIGAETCGDLIFADVLAYIQQLEQERIMLMNTVSKMCGKTPRWISMEERPPDNGQHVIVHVKHTEEWGGDWSAVMEDCWCDGEWDVNADTDIHKVTHWQPMPEKPKEV